MQKQYKLAISFIAIILIVGAGLWLGNGEFGQGRLQYNAKAEEGKLVTTLVEAPEAVTRTNYYTPNIIGIELKAVGGPINLDSYRVQIAAQNKVRLSDFIYLINGRITDEGGRYKRKGSRVSQITEATRTITTDGWEMPANSTTRLEIYLEVKGAYEVDADLEVIVDNFKINGNPLAIHPNQKHSVRFNYSN